MKIEDYIKQKGLDKGRGSEWNTLNRYYLYSYLKSECNLSLKEIAKMFGKSNHSPILYGLRQHNSLIDGANKVHYLTTISESLMSFPTDKLKVDIPTTSDHERFIKVKGDNLKKLKIIKDKMGKSNATYEDAVAFLIKNTIII